VYFRYLIVDKTLFKLVLACVEDNDDMMECLEDAGEFIIGPPP
jgi:hypothetical protein